MKIIQDKKSFFMGMTTSFLVCSFVGLVIAVGVFVWMQSDTMALMKAAEGSFTKEEITKLIAYKQKLKVMYYEDLTDEQIMEGMLDGMMESTGDPYTCYYSAEELAEITSDMEGTFFGIGAYLQADFTVGYAKISGVMKNSPALESGLEENDYIIRVDDEDMYEKDLNYIVSKVRGPSGTVVKLTVNRAGEELDIEVTRREITVESVSYELKEDGIAYIQITEFNDNTSPQFTEALAQMESDGAKGLVIDLRGNPGGNLSAVVAVCNQILPEGKIVYTEDKYGKGNEYLSEGKTPFDKPLVVLVDGGSASAAEIMAGAIKDYGIGELVGTTTFGKGIVQNVFTYPDGSGGKLTVSKYFTPNGTDIHKIGVEPDVEVVFDAQAYQEDQTDNQLNKALEILRDQIN